MSTKTKAREYYTKNNEQIKKRKLIYYHRNKEQINIRRRELYRSLPLEKRHELARKRYWKDPRKANQKAREYSKRTDYHKKYWGKNRERLSQYHKEYYQKHKKKIRAYNKQYKIDHPEQTREGMRKYRLRKKQELLNEQKL